MLIFCINSPLVLPLSVTVGAVVGSALLCLLVIAGAICCAIYQTRTKQKYNITKELNSMNTSGGELQLENMAYISISAQTHLKLDTTIFNADTHMTPQIKEDDVKTIVK